MRTTVPRADGRFQGVAINFRRNRAGSCGLIGAALLHHALTGRKLYRDEFLVAHALA
jgi:hypothetical protein